MTNPRDESLVPTGTVTFLFTDIEGSTKLWEAHPDSMRASLARHDDLIRQTIAAASGFVFKTMGDAFYAAFAMAPDAISAALAAQRAIVAEPWPAETPIKVRMTLHTGAVERRDGDYFGPALNRVARLLSTSHGGQTLLSQTTYELVRDSLPEMATLHDLGAHQLKDLARAEQVFELRHPDLPVTLAPIKSLSTHPNNLPQQLTTFIGRDKEIADVRALMGRARLLTLTGAGGSGKTRLSLQVAADALEQFPDGVWLVELAPLTDPGLVAQTVATVLGVKEAAGKPMLETLAEHLKRERLLLIVDNCEHVLDASAHLANALLRQCPGVRLLASSREALGIVGEQTYRVPSLSLPDRKHAQTAQTLSVYESVQLFIDRALLVRPDFQVNNQNAPALASLCHHLDGIPLAIELAAARVRSLSVEEIDGKLDQRFRLLTGGSRTALPRQQTLRSLIDWSYDLLRTPERRLLQRLSVFAGGWTLAAAEWLRAADGADHMDVLDVLTSLTDKSLVVADESDGHSRYRLLETVRQYARERLMESGGGDTVRQRHRDYFLALAEEAEPKLVGAEQAEWLRLLEREHENLRASLDWSVTAADTEGGLRLCAALLRFWLTRGHLLEGREWSSRALQNAKDAEPTQARAEALNAAGILAFYQGDYLSAQQRHDEALAIMRQLGDRRGMALSLNNLGNVAYEHGDFAAARELHEKSLAIARELGDRSGIASSLGNIGNVALDQGDYAAARKLYEECLAMMRELGNVRGIAFALENLGNTARQQGDYRGAQTLYEESLTIVRGLEDRWSIANSLNNLGVVALGLGDLKSSRALFEESLELVRELGDRRGVALCLGGLGAVAHEEGDYRGARALHREALAIVWDLGDKFAIALSLEGVAAVDAARDSPLRAARIWSAAERLREEIGSPLPPRERARYDRRLAEARAALADDAAFDEAWGDGRASTLEAAVTHALGEKG